MILESALLCLALNIYHEARNQSVQGMIAVAEVVMNRAQHQQDKVCAVVFKPYQFSWANKMTTTQNIEQRELLAKRFVPKDNASWKTSLRIAKKTLQGRAPSVVTGATHYFNPDKVKRRPKWADKLTEVAQVGDHLFYSSSF